MDNIIDMVPDKKNKNENFELGGLIMNFIEQEGINHKGKYEQTPLLTKDFVKKSIEFVIGKIDENLEKFTHVFPSSASVDNVYQGVQNVEWTTSFWTGMLWLAYEFTGDDKYRKIAEIQLESFEKRIEQKKYTATHDLGFLYSLSCVAAYKLTDNEKAKEIALKAADELIIRYLPKAKIIQAWGDLSNEKQRGRMIIDCNMNLPLLYWASEVTGDKKYYDIAYNHAKQAQKYIVREDASTFHTYYMNSETGEPIRGETHQGYSDDSCWSRGQAWGIYGFPLSYIYTKDASFLETTSKLTNYFLNRLPEDYISYWDLIFTEGNEERDSSAAVIAACGLLEMIKHLPETDENKKLFKNAAIIMIKSLTENYTTINTPKSNGVLLHGVYGKPNGNGIDECCIWGDYYYLEALVRLYKDWELYW